MAVKYGTEVILEGAAVCPGVAIGKPYLFQVGEIAVTTISLLKEEVEEEILRFRHALACSQRDLERLKVQLELEGAVEGASIMEAHLHLLQDPMITTELEEQVRQRQVNAEAVFYDALMDLEENFSKIKDRFFRERIKDIQDVGRRVLRHLRNTAPSNLSDLPRNSIVFARELGPSDTAEAKSLSVGGFVSEGGGETSHTAIMAKAKGVPYVANINFSVVEGGDYGQVIVDGRGGRVILDPSKETLAEYRSVRKRIRENHKRVSGAAALASETRDGHRIALSANVELASEVKLIKRQPDCGIGLFRTEYLFLENGVLPCEEEQYAVYSKMVSRMAPQRTVIRTFDLGGDKFGELLQVPEEENPFLGCRAIRYLLRERELFKTQLRALFRASVEGPLHVMFPMVSGVSELREANQVVDEVKEDLRREGLAFNEEMPIGCMIEVPSAALQCGPLAKECAFLSIGTNDLIQYTLAVDRGSQQMSYLYTPAHPSVLRLMRIAINDGSKAGVSVSVCGEMAADPRFTALLVGLGVSELSMPVRFLPTIKTAIRSISRRQAEKLAQEVLKLATPDEVMARLVTHYERYVEQGG